MIFVTETPRLFVALGRLVISLFSRLAPATVNSASLLSLCVLSACMSLPANETANSTAAPTAQPAPPPTLNPLALLELSTEQLRQQAEQSYRQADFHSAARLFGTLAAESADPAQRAGLQLRAALAWQQAGDVAKAQIQAQQVRHSQLTLSERAAMTELQRALATPNATALNISLATLEADPRPVSAGSRHTDQAFSASNQAAAGRDPLEFTGLGKSSAYDVSANRQRIGRPYKIALLIPETGRLQGAGQAILQGFNNAMSSGEAYFDLHTFDSNAYPDPSRAYHEALEQEAELFVGPLQKDQVDQLLRHYEHPIPVLSLNESDQASLNHSQVYQFALRPEDEARSAALRMAEDGIRRVAIFTPADARGYRISEEFAKVFTESGGEVIKTASFAAGSDQLKEDVARLLESDGDRPLWRDIRSADNAEGEDDGRYANRQASDQQIDAVFFTGSPRDAQIIRPMFLFQRALDLPLYATGWVLNERHKTNQTDLAGVTICSAPILLSEHINGLDFAAMSPAKENSGLPKRLTAFGRDAAVIISSLDQLARSPTLEYPGQTGYLRLDRDNRIRRRAECAVLE